MGWTDHEFSIPDPRIIFPSKIQELWNNDHTQNSRKMWSWDNDLFGEICLKKITEKIIRTDEDN